MSSDAADRAYLDGLGIGLRPDVDVEGIAGWGIFPFETEGLTAKVLEPPVLPEPPRHGETGPDTCSICADPAKDLIWSDEDWLVRHAGEPTAVPLVLLLCPRAHHDLSDLPPRLAGGLGPMVQRVERAMAALPGVGRVHLNKWGDGAAHMHLFLFARPVGMQQLLGSCLVLWDDILPRLDETLWRANLTAVAASLGEGP